MKTLVPALVLSLMAFGAHAADADCLSAAERRTAIAENRAQPLASVTARLHSNPNVKGELVGARLCREDDVLVYRLTVLERNGKVVRANVRAEDGALLSLR